MIQITIVIVIEQIIFNISINNDVSPVAKFRRSFKKSQYTSTQILKENDIHYSVFTLQEIQK